jgi:hypothetical protein
LGAPLQIHHLTGFKAMLSKSEFVVLSTFLSFILFLILIYKIHFKIADFFAEKGDFPLRKEDRKKLFRFHISTILIGMLLLFSYLAIFPEQLTRTIFDADGRRIGVEKVYKK